MKTVSTLLAFVRPQKEPESFIVLIAFIPNEFFVNSRVACDWAWYSWDVTIYGVYFQMYFSTSSNIVSSSPRNAMTSSYCKEKKDTSKQPQSVLNPGAAVGIIRNVPWLLMPWLLGSPGHRHPRYCLCKINCSFASVSKGFKCLRHLHVWKWWEKLI